MMSDDIKKRLKHREDMFLRRLFGLRVDELIYAAAKERRQAKSGKWFTALLHPAREVGYWCGSRRDRPRVCDEEIFDFIFPDDELSPQQFPDASMSRYLIYLDNQ